LNNETEQARDYTMSGFFYLMATLLWHI